MGQSLKARLTRGLLLVAYLFATQAASLFHDHSADHPCTAADHCAGNHHAGDHDSCDAHEHGFHEHGFHEHDGEIESQAASLPAHDPLADDDCAVCRFLGLKTLPVAPPVAVDSHELVATSEPAEPVHEACPIEGTTHSRAPPQLG
ncbi:MAG TPA: hypothetical protein VMF30_07835 [Pirellulales bacterium]|nr:hypothetical protein [Pirellulales bacterium]